MRYILYTIIVFVSLQIGCFKSNKPSALDKFIRTNYSDDLKKMDKPNYNKIIGYIPTKNEINLGRMLFNDVILSRNNDVSCATCHLTNHGFATGNRLDFGALGVGGPTGNSVSSSWALGKLSTKRHCGDDGFGFNCESPMFRNALSTVNVVYRSDPIHNSGLLWDGRFGNLQFQTLLPIHTKEELCGTNPLPSDKENVFKKSGPLFKAPVLVKHSHAGNRYSGEQFEKFNSKPEKIEGVDSFRKNKTKTVPLRNECTAIAVAKIRSIKKYREMFKNIYNDEVKDVNIGKALAAFISTHVSNNTPYDKYVRGDNRSLTKEQKIGLAIFFNKEQKPFKIADQKFIGGNCVSCHEAPLFGGSSFSSIAVKSDKRSALSKPSLVFDVGRSGFFSNLSKQRGEFPRCHIKNITTTNTYAPDMGRALATYKVNDCFKFRVPSLRNVIETAPYMHHGTFTGQGESFDDDFKKQSYYALKQAISYHLRGIKNWRIEESFSTQYKYYDSFFNLDYLIPINRIDFISPSLSSNKIDDGVYNTSLNALVDFVAHGLWDKNATKYGYFGNDVSHPKSVPSGFFPTVTRDQGSQTELPPNTEL